MIQGLVFCKFVPCFVFYIFHFICPWLRLMFIKNHLLIFQAHTVACLRVYLSVKDPPQQQNSSDFLCIPVELWTCFGRSPLPCSAIAVMSNRAYLSPLQISLLIFAFCICGVVIWYDRGHWQLFICTELSHDAGIQTTLCASPRFYKIIPRTAVCPLTNSCYYFYRRKSSCTTSPNPLDNIWLHN